MLNRFARAFFTRLFTPIARLLIRVGVSPDAVTIVGTLGVCVGALAFFPRGELFWGTIVVTAFVFSDTVDGMMARMTGRTGRWGSFLDSTLDRVGDGAVFAGLVLWFANEGEMVLAAVTLACLVLGGVVSYAKARAEGLGMTADVGIAERADRLVATLVAAGLSGLGVPYVLEVVLWVLAVLSLVTVLQRMVVVHRQANRGGRQGGRRPVAVVRSSATAAAYRIGWVVVCRLPEGLAHAAFRIAADVMWRRRGRSVVRYESNVRPLLDGPVPDERLRALSRAAMRSYLRYWCEAFRLNATERSTLLRRIRVEGEGNLRDPLAVGRGVICALPHMANWDHAGAWAVATGVPFTTVAERLRPASLFDAFVAYRQSLGMEVLAADDPDVFATLSTRLRAGRMVALVADRDLTARGIEVAFGRGRTRMPAGPAALALRTGADLVPVSLWYDGPALRLRFHPPVARPPGLHGAAAAAAMTQRVADVFAAGVAAHPQDWHMLQRFWVE